MDTLYQNPYDCDKCLKVCELEQKNSIQIKIKNKIHFQSNATSFRKILVMKMVAQWAI